MEIIRNKEVDNFTYVNDLCKGRKVLNGFNKLEELMLSEYIVDKDYECQNIFFEKEMEATLYINYPLSVVVKENIKFSSLHDIIKAIRKLYKQIYKDEKKANKGGLSIYGIWGHYISDLCIECIQILEGEDKPIIRIYIGS